MAVARCLHVMPSLPTGTELQRNSTAVARALIASPAPLGSGGLGGATAEFAEGLTACGAHWSYVGPQPPGRTEWIAGSRPYRRLFGMAAYRRRRSRTVRRAVPSQGWDLVYATPESLPAESFSGVCVLLQATHHPAIEWAALRDAERRTGGRGDMSRAERKRRELEIAHADLIHVTSHAVREELLEAGVPAARLLHSPHGVDVERFHPGPKAEHLTVAFVGPLSLRKGIDIVAILASRLGGEATVTTVGGPTCPWSRRVAEAAPLIPSGSVPEALSSAHALVLPSRSDGFSLVVLEALASGTVPLVTPQVGAAEIVRQLDERLVIPEADFAEAAADLIPRLPYNELAPRARVLAEGFDRRHTSRALASGVLAHAKNLLTD